MDSYKIEANNGEPDDWPETWREMRDIDTLLRCSICCEYMDTAMILAKCSHSYCSLCIRRSICYKTQCPTCFVPATDGDMINNRSLNDIIQKFSTIRKKLLGTLRSDSVVGKDAAPTLGSTSTAQTQSKTSPVPRVQTKLSEEENPSLESIKYSGKGKTPIVKSSSSSHLKSDALHGQSSRYFGLRKGSGKQYIQSDDSDTRDSDSDSDVIICGEEASDSSDEDFDSKTPFSKGKRGRSTGSLVNSVSRLSDRLILPSESSSSCSTSDGRGREGLGSPGQQTSKTFTFSACKRDESRGTSPLRFPSLKTSLTLPTATPVKSEMPSSSSNTPSTSSGAKTITRVPCPVCGVDVPDKHINLHLDRCLSNKDRPQTRVVPKRKLMPKLVYNLLNDKELKKKCNEVGLNNQGDRKALIKRHHEFTLLYNAECDSAIPRSAAEIIREVERTERAKTNGLKMKSSSTIVNKLVIQKGASTDQVEQAQKDYVKQHKSQFAQLIEEARKRRMKKQQEKAAAEDEESEQKPRENAQPQPSVEESTGISTTDNSSEDVLDSVPNLNVNNNNASEGAISADSTDNSLPALPKSLISHEASLTATGAGSPVKQTNSDVPLFPARPQELATVHCDADSGLDNNMPVEHMPEQPTEEEDMETQFVEDDGDGISDADLVRELNQTLEAHDADETLPLEDSQEDAGSDDDLFDSPPSPSLLEQSSQMPHLEDASTAEEHVENEPERGPPTLVLEAEINRTTEPQGGELSAQMDTGITGDETEVQQPLKETKQTRSRRGRQKKDSKCKSTESQQTAVGEVPHGGNVQDVPQFSLGWADLLGPAEDDHGHGHGEFKDHTAETLSETASIGTSFSGASGSFADSDPWREDSLDAPLDVLQPRRSGRARQKRRLSGSSDQVAPPVGKRSRRSERRTEPETVVTETASRATEQVMEPPGEEGGRRGQRRRRKY